MVPNYIKQLWAPRAEFISNSEFGCLSNKYDRMEYYIFLFDPFQALTFPVFESIYRFGRGIKQ